MSHLKEYKFAFHGSKVRNVQQNFMFKRQKVTFVEVFLRKTDFSIGNHSGRQGTYNSYHTMKILFAVLLH